MDKISQYDYMEAVTPAPSYDPEPPEDEALAVAASMVREALRLAALGALSDPVNGGICWGAWRACPSPRSDSAAT